MPQHLRNAVPTRPGTARLHVYGCAIVVAFLALLAGVGAHDAPAHAGLQLSDPAPGAILGDTPTSVRLTFVETPEASLSDVRVLDTTGATYQVGKPRQAADDARALVVPVKKLGRGVYTVSWRAVSAVDGHATSGAYAFGVRASPLGAALAVDGGTKPVSSSLEVLARWILLLGLVALLGAASAGAAGFAGAAGGELVLGAVGWGLAAVGVLLLAEAQRRNADASIGALADTSVGRALAWRGVGVGAAGVALFVAWRSRRFRPWAMLAAAGATMAAMAVHVAAGHAAAGAWPPAATVAAQWAHFAAAGVWLGGLAALLLGVRGAPSDAKARAVRRFSTVAGTALVVVAATGVARAVDELSSWRDLVTTGYGRAVVVKVALLLFIAMLGLRHRQRSVPGAGSDLGPLRRTSRVELVLAAGALATAALLGTLSPPAAGQPAAPPGLTAVGSDADNTVRVRLTAVSAEPGPNRFVARVSDYDSNAPTRAGAITLRFVPLDDPRVSSTSLVLTPADGDVYEGSGANLAFDGRWGVTVLVPRGASTLQVPLELATREPPQPVSIQRIPGTAPKFTVAVGTVGFVRISPNHERGGLTRLSVISFDPFGDELPVKEIVVTAAAANGPTRQLRVRRVTASRFVTSVDLRVGRNTIGVVERTSDGTRLRATIPLRIRR